MASKKKMEQADAHYLNVTLQNNDGEENREEVVISISEILRQFKRFLLPWFLVAVIVGGLIAGTYILLDASPASPVKSLVSFNYSGIENGKNPDGSEFQADKLKSPEVIANALESCGLELELVEKVRQGIVINPIIPSDALDRITTYSYLYENASSGALNAAEEMLDVSWYSTQYQIKFNYSQAGLSRDKAAELLNAMTEEFRKIFIRDYGYNNALGTELNNMKYTEYDYAEAVDLFDNTLSRLRSYVNALAGDDNIRFRSTATGFTFADLRASIDSIRELDLDLISSYVTQNNVTKDKDRLQAYYEYRIEDLARQQVIYEETLQTITDSIENYQKDSIYIFANDVNTQSSTASEQYDKMIAQKISTQTSLSETVQRIEYYNQRLAVLRKSTVGATDKVEKVENDLANLDAKVKTLVTQVEQTADDYYQNYSLSGAYSVLVPASYSAKEVIINGIKDAFKLVLAVELVLVALYFMIAFISALVISSRQRKMALEKADAAAVVDAAVIEAAVEDADAEEETPVSHAKENGRNKK